MASAKGVSGTGQSPLWKSTGRRLGAGAAIAVLIGSATVAAAETATLDTATGDATLLPAAQTKNQIAQSREARRFDIPAQPLADALTLFGRQAGLQVTLKATIADSLSAPEVSGSMPPQQALQRLLAGTGIVWHFSNDNTVALERPENLSGAIVLDPIQVEGKLSAPPTAAIGTLPQEYAGGQVARGGRLGVLGNQDMMDVPFNIASYTEETIRNQQAETIADVLANDPSVRAAYGYGNFSELFVIRGFEVSPDDISIDGMYGNAPRQVVALEMYERVEVLKGAGAFLNGVAPGGSGVGGGINLVPKRAKDEPLTRVTGSFAQKTIFGGHADIGRRFGPDKAFGVRVNAALREGETAIEDEERYSHLASLGFDYRGDRTRLTVDTGTQRQRIDQGRPVVFVTGPTVPDAPSAGDNYARSYSYSELTDSFIQAQAEYDITDALTAYAGLGFRSMREDGDYATVTVTDSAGNATAGLLTVPREDENKSGQLGMRGELETGPVLHLFNVGVSALRTVNKNAFDFGFSSATSIYDPIDSPRPDSFFSGGDFDNLPKVSDTYLRSLYVSDTLSFFDERVSVTLGARAQSIRTKQYDRTTLRETSSYDQSAVTPVIGLVVKPTDEISLYANRIESLAQGPTAPNTAINVGQVFPPFTSTQYEVGGKLDLGNFGGSLAFFETTKPSGVTDLNTNVFGVDGDQRNRGIELTLFGEPLDGVRLLGGITLTDAELQKTAGGTNDGNKASGAPAYQANFGAEWDLPFLSRATVSARVLHTASQYLDVENTLKAPSWTRFDIGGRLTRTISEQDVTFLLNVENIANTAYWASAQGGYLTQGNPLAAKFSISMDF